MHRAITSKAVKYALAVLLLAASVVASAGTLRCLLGLQMACATPIVAQPKTEDCCHPKKAAAPKTANKCCCIDALKKSPGERAAPSSLDFRIDFPILLAAPVKLEVSSPVIVVTQIRWPEVHGPPDRRITAVSPRAPPALL